MTIYPGEVVAEGHSGDTGEWSLKAFKEVEKHINEGTFVIYGDGL